MPLQQLVWKTAPAVPRAKPLPAERWEEHREVLCDLYTRMTLEDLMKFMQTRHKFSPTRKQYVLQFERWGVHKYKRSHAASNAAEPSNAAESETERQFDLGRASGTPDTPPASELPRHVLAARSKRRPPPPPSKERQASSGTSLGAQSSSIDPKQQLRPAEKVENHPPPPPPKKRQKLETFISQKEWGNLEQAFGFTSNSTTDANTNTSTNTNSISNSNGNSNTSLASPDTSMTDLDFPSASSRPESQSPKNTVEQTEKNMANIRYHQQPFLFPTSFSIETWRGQSDSITHTRASSSEEHQIRPPSLRGITPESAGLADISPDPTGLLQNSKSKGKGVDYGEWSPRSRERRSTSKELPVAVIDCSKPADTFSYDQILTINVAADLLLHTHCYQDAFELYVLLIKWTTARPPCRFVDELATYAVLGCARSAITDAHISITQNLLNQRLARRPAYAVDTAETFLCRSILSNLYWRSGDKTNAQTHKNLALRSRLVETRSLSCLAELPNRSLDLVTYQVLVQVLVDEGKQAFIPAIKDSMVCLKPGPFGYSRGKLSNTVLRGCLAWIRHAISSRGMDASWKNLRTLDSKNNLRTGFMTLFCTVWGALRYRTEVNKVPSWTQEAPFSLGISPTETLAAISLVLQHTAPSELRIIESDFPYHYLDAVLKAVDKALLLPPLKLATTFLDALGDIKRLFRPGSTTEQKAYNTLARDYVRAFVQKQLRLTLPPIPSPTTIPTQDRAAFMAPQTDHGAAVNTSDLFPALAESLRSRDLQSMEALREQIDGGLQAALSKMSLELPSAALGGEGASSIVSWPSLEGVGFGQFATAAGGSGGFGSLVSVPGEGVVGRGVEMLKGRLGEVEEVVGGWRRQAVH
ncbi:hypothetical protein B0T25DRAFT_223732 [Lasiosphaeria hispida]|uniref:Clr5 domain-containing protein n=1 Tax=Lasiosphaeria hispida TaxID=260671 RepID=A0AAJ0HK12_9PEZI|nr:hypothetical protein B0T25DRAFT_223732 [Lasiosphaeria hispida]